MKYFCAAFATGTLWLLGYSATAQTTPDEYEKLKIENAKLRFENANLKKGILAGSPATAQAASQPGGGVAATQHQTARKIDFALVKCQGDAKAQTVTVTLLLTNAAASQAIQFVRVKAVDEKGEEYQTFDIHIGSQSQRNTLATGVPVKTTFVISKVLPFNQIFRVISCPIYAAGNYPETNIEFRDVAITWQ